MTETKPPRGRRLSDKEFDASVRHTRLTPTSIEVAHLVLVEGVSQVEASKTHGLTEPRTSKIVNTVWSAFLEKVQAKDLDLPQVALVRADYDVLVANLRRRFGDEMKIRPPEQDRQYSGPIVERTDFYAAQDTGRSGLVIHRLSQLDVSPKIGSIASITYSDGQAKVKVRGERTPQASVER
ncbi:MAG TPA: TrfB-related DNA-binding protein [Noviherbaspirillum sp.]